MILLNPGPVLLSERVRRALVREDLCHREPEFAALLLDLRRRLLRTYPGAADGFEAILLTGSGTSAVEAMLASLAPAAGRVLVAANGVYGERMCAMLAAQGRDPVEVRSEWLAPMDLERIDELLVADAGITHVAAVHNETTTGRLNDVTALGRICRSRGRALLLDAVSSFGAEEIDFESWGLEAVAATANKCLHGAPGVSFVLAARAALDRRDGRPPSLYLDLHRYRETQARGFSPFTPAVHVCHALQEALRELEEKGGWPARRERYRELSGRIADALVGRGVEPLLPAEAYSSMIRSYRLPAGLAYGELHDALKERGFVVYAGQGRLAESIFRIATMGDLRDEDVERLVTALADLLRR